MFATFNYLPVLLVVNIALRAASTAQIALPSTNITIVSTDTRCASGSLLVGTILGMIAATGGTPTYSYTLSAHQHPRFNINSATGEISAAYTSLVPGTYFTVVKVSDLHGARSSGVVTINACVPTTLSFCPVGPPQFTSSSYFYAVQCIGTAGQFVGSAAATSPYGAPLTYSVSPAGFKINSKGQITSAVGIIVPGVQLITIKATDSNGLTSTASATVNIIGPCT